MTENNHDFKDLSLANQGRDRIERALTEIPVLRQLQDRFAKQRPLTGGRISGCLHISTETANLTQTLVLTFAINREDDNTYCRHIGKALDHHPQLTRDDATDKVSELYESNDITPWNRKI